MPSWKMTPHALSALLAACTLLAGGCVAEETVHPFLPGEPMQFPVDARPALLHLGRGLAINCESGDAERTAKCTRTLYTRAERCLPDVHGLGMEAYRSTAREYFDCVMPLPIWQGVELTRGAGIADCPPA